VADMYRDLNIAFWDQCMYRALHCGISVSAALHRRNAGELCGLLLLPWQLRVFPCIACIDLNA